MDPFAVTEARMHYFHRVVMDEALRHPALLDRARRTAAAMRHDDHGVVTEWCALLDGSPQALLGAVLAQTPRGGLLRATSPVVDSLSPDERNQLWQRMGLHQFVALYLRAAEDLDLSNREQAMILKVEEEQVAGWTDAPPTTMTGAELEALKLVVAIQRALERIFPERVERLAWLRRPVAAFAARPVDLMASGHAAPLRDYLTTAVQPLIAAEDRPKY